MKKVALFIGPLIGILTPLVVNLEGSPHASLMLGIVIWMALWWITECVPLAVTALIPLLAFPLAGIAPAKEVAPRYMTSIMFLFIGGFLIAQAMEKTGLHRRVALQILSWCHASPLQIVMGFMITTATLSMWISNTATTMLMVTIALAVLSQLDSEGEQCDVTPFAAVLLLAIAYSANIGGMGTPVGTVPNMVFLEVMTANASDKTPSFLQWMVVAIPIVITALVALLLVIRRRVQAVTWNVAIADHVAQMSGALGKMRREEKIVAWVLGLTALAWMTRQGIQAENFNIPGWSSLLPNKGIDDGTVGIAGALSLFLLRNDQGKPVLEQDAFTRLPWGILILLGGGFALAMGMQVSGLSEWIGNQIDFTDSTSLIIGLLLIAFLMTFLTEVTSNTAITQVMLPILAAVALANNQDIVLMMLVATLCSSCAFMLPVATPPNAIVFGTQRVSMSEMVSLGIRLNIIMPLIIVLIASQLRFLLP
ncbi:MAG: SLC13 family permease [Gammaproteobacteria bacterium]